ncbi:MAG: GNAT family N-acetyltransferase [archaeon]
MTRIRKATAQDIPVLLTLWEEFMDDHDGIVIKSDPMTKAQVARKPDATSAMRRFFSSIIRSPNGLALVVEDDDGIGGYLLADIRPNIPVFAIKRICYISDLYIRKPLRRQRWATKMKEMALSWMKKKGVKYVAIGLHSQNKKAYAIYKAWGFSDHHIEMRKQLK